MNFSEFYKDAQRELTSTFISMFAKGRPEYAEHLRWIFNNEEKEKLVQKPVFQSVFPWRTYPRPMSELTDLLGQDFINALDSKKPIIVVNIQKFLDLQDALSAAGKKLKKMRVAFLIDEIHRSNSGENNQEMIDLFARLQESFNVGGQTVVKKNLLIGFTATPSDDALARFGEFRSALTKPMWIPLNLWATLS